MDTGELRQSGEKIYIDCGTVTLNTECTVDIPPREHPFRIGIRAYDINNPEGSFVMIDNIFYEASFCKVSSLFFMSHFVLKVLHLVEFGPNFKTENLMTGADGMPIETAHQLNCNEFDKTCRWRNGGHGKTVSVNFFKFYINLVYRFGKKQPLLHLKLSCLMKLALTRFPKFPLHSCTLKRIRKRMISCILFRIRLLVSLLLAQPSLFDFGQQREFKCQFVQWILK